MPGGPVNGVPLFGAVAQAGIEAGRRTNITDSIRYAGIVVPTVLQMASDALAFWTNLTCLYDPYHVADPDKMTLPICMFNVVEIAPVYTVEASKRRIILYEPLGNDDPSNRFRENVMRSIINNSVKQPTTYNMEIIVPFQPIGRYITENIKAIGDMITGLNDLLHVPESPYDWESMFSSIIESPFIHTTIIPNPCPIKSRISLTTFSITSVIPIVWVISSITPNNQNSEY